MHYANPTPPAQPFSTPTFATPNAAFHAYELSLLRPRTWPPTRHHVPTLWQRAKDMFGVAGSTLTSAADLFRRVCFTRRQRGELAARLALVKKLVRVLMMTEAAEFLLMTPEGRALREPTLAGLPTHHRHRGVPETWNACALVSLFNGSAHKHDPG